MTMFETEYEHRKTRFRTKKTRKQPRNKKKLLLLALLVLLLVTIGSVGFFYLNKDNNQDTNSGNQVACSDDVITQAKNYMDNDKFNELSTLSGEILEKPGYEKDVNCLYILIVNYLQQGEGSKGRKYFEYLVAIYNPNEGYSKIFGMDSLDPTGLSMRIEALEQRAKEPSETLILGGQERDSVE